MAEQAERYKGTWQGCEVSFKRVFRGRRLSDAECAMLCAGEEIEVQGLVSKIGRKYSVIARLNDMNYNGHSYVGVEQVSFVAGIPDEWCQHKLTDDEKAMLESGHKVVLTGCVSKKGNTFDVAVTWEEEDGRMRLVPHFQD